MPGLRLLPGEPTRSQREVNRAFGSDAAVAEADVAVHGGLLSDVRGHRDPGPVQIAYGLPRVVDLVGVELPGVRGAVELWLPSGDGALRSLREGHGGAAGDRSRCRVVQELLYAGYQSAGSSRRVKLPFDASGWPSPSTFGGRPTTCECEQPQIPGEGLKSRCRSRA